MVTVTKENEQTWTRAKSLFSQGFIVKGRVEQLHDFAAFLSIPGTEFPGVIVIASLSDTKQPLTVADFPQVGTHVRAIVIGHRDAGRQIALSLRRSDFKRFQVQRPKPNIHALLSLSIEYGNRHFDAKLVDVGNLEAELKNWLFDDRRAVWSIFSDGLISEREARDLLLQKICDYYRLTLSRVIIKDATDDPAEDEPFDLVLFGHAARDAPPPPG